MNSCLIIPAGGIGKRFGSVKPKQFHNLEGIPIIIRTIASFDNINTIKSIVIPAPAAHIEELQALINDYKMNKKIVIINGGKERQDSVHNALQTKEAAESELVLIHDAVRPFVSESLILKLIDFANRTGGAIPALMPKETIREIMPGGSYRTPERRLLRSIQTPQVFRTKLLLAAFAKAIEDKYISTDDAALFEYAGYNYLMIEGEERNIKITSADDLITAAAILGYKEK